MNKEINDKIIRMKELADTKNLLNDPNYYWMYNEYLLESIEAEIASIRKELDDWSSREYYKDQESPY